MKFYPVDSWKPTEEQKIFKEVKGAVIAPINKFYGLDDDNDINYFILIHCWLSHR